MTEKREFTVAAEYRYNRRGPGWWILSHALRYRWLPLVTVLFGVLVSVGSSAQSILVGRAFDLALKPGVTARLVLGAALGILGVALARAVCELVRNTTNELLAQRVERDSRDELYLSLLGKSLTFHGRQRVGDVMARATNDVHQLNLMISPGFSLLFSSLVGLVVPVVAIPLSLRPDLMAAPLVFVVLLVVTLRRYILDLDPIVGDLREKFGVLNARLAEAVTGIEVVKGFAQEEQEKRIFRRLASEFRDAYVRQGYVEARYLPLLVFSAALGGGLLHALMLLRQGALSFGEVVTYMGLLQLLSFPTFISIFSFALVQLGIAGARRILELIKTETELDENPLGVAAPIAGEIEFDHVSFGYNGAPVLRDISFRARPGQTVAIVGETGSGKSTLTRLVNRTYDVTKGRVLVDGVDVREWSLASLRSQVSAIEQDVFLFSRSLAENIAFGVEGTPGIEEVQRAAREAQAHDFIMGFPDGYSTEIGERGVTLSGGQRQRIAIARALLTNPRILILDDATSAIDSATEDQIQRAMRRIMKGRTTLLITHRLSQIRWADWILVLRRGEVIDQGTHEDLLVRSEPYKRIFVRYLPAGAPGAAGGAE